MSLVNVRLTIPYDELEFGQILHNENDIRVEFPPFVPTGNVLPYVRLETADLSSFEERVRGDDRVASLARVHDGLDETLYRIEWALDHNHFLNALQEHDLVVEEAIGTDGEWRVLLWGSDRSGVAAFRTRLREHGTSSTLTGIWRPRAPDGAPYGLTDKQREALELAFAEGYFDVPTETNLTELADRVGITRQSFSRRLKRGLRRLLSNTLVTER